MSEDRHTAGGRVTLPLITGGPEMTRTVDDVLADWRVIMSGRTHYEGQEPRDDELMVAEIDRLRAVVAEMDAALAASIAVPDSHYRHDPKETGMDCKTCFQRRNAARMTRSARARAKEAG